MLETDFVPAREKDSRWLMVVLHGLGDSMEGYRWLPQMLRMTRLNYLLVNAPDAYYGGFSWYDFALDPAPGVRRSYDALSSLLDEQRQHGFRTEETFLFGFSQGCLMTIEVGLSVIRIGSPGLSASAVTCTSRSVLLKELSPVATEQRFLLTHGTHDPLIPSRAGARANEAPEGRGLENRMA